MSQDHAASSTPAARRIILRCNSSNEHYFGDCEYVLVDVTPRLVEYLRGLAGTAREAWAKHHSLWELYFWGQPPELDFYSGELLTRCQDAIPPNTPDPGEWENGLDANGWQDVPEATNTDNLESTPTECVQTVIRCDNLGDRVRIEVAWFCYPRHCSEDITTEAVRFSELEEMVR